MKGCEAVSMSSSVPYINTNKKIEEKSSVTKSDKSLAFSLTGNTYANLLKNSKKPMKAKKIKSTVRSSDSSYAINRPIDKKLSISTIVEKMNKTIYLPTQTDTVQKSFIKTANYYNRFKVANPNSALQKGFPHVFFVRPSCNILKNSGKDLINNLKSNELFAYAFNSSKEVLKQLVSSNGSNHDFMLSLSNHAASFSLSDEYINSDTYGKTYTGYKIAYGKNNIESKTAGNFDVTYNDDRNLHIYQLHRCWVEYINGVYRGEISPSNSNIMNKVIDYVGACYYFLTAEDGETIIFWSKYYGVFPTTIPSSQYSWGEGNTINNPQLQITYNFSFKEDFNPYTIMEFNYNSRVGNNGTEYLPVYDKNLGHTGDTWVTTPFIEVVTTKDSDCPYQYKLRFRPRS